MLRGFAAHGSLTLLVLGLMAAGFGAPIPEDPILLAAGALAHRSPSLPVPYVFALVYGSVISAYCGLYFLGRRFGDALFSRWPLRWIATPARRQRARQLLGRYGAQAIFWGRHVAGVSSLLFVLAGSERVPFRTFLLFDALAALITVPVVFRLGFAFADHLARVEHWLIAGLGVALFAAIVVWSVRRPKS